MCSWWFRPRACAPVRTSRCWGFPGAGDQALTADDAAPAGAASSRFKGGRASRRGRIGTTTGPLDRWSWPCVRTRRAVRPP
ncbi:hypothetical protein ACFOLD_07010 [Kocuria carniphila]|uniref:hypothetical protein n=1 Tax=Kocuria carniphila TaxID=262208 RepID=UPI003614C2A4